jgi:glycine/D-amino acid oxidase-like deaminating enzyme
MRVVGLTTDTQTSFRFVDNNSKKKKKNKNVIIIRRAKRKKTMASLNSSKVSDRRDDKIVILGAGLQGLASAYFLIKRGCTDVTIIERSDKIAPAASGKAGGFLAGEWGDSNTKELHEKSFKLHEELAKELHIESFRKIRTLSVQAGANGLADPLVTWLDGDIQQNSILDTDTAQVTPAELAQKLHDFATKNGLKTLYNTECTGIRFKNDHNDDITPVVVDGVHIKTSNSEKTMTIDAKCCVIALGPWTTRASDWFPNAHFPMTGIKSTSIVFEASEQVLKEPAALFCAEDSRFGTHLEVYPRSDGSVYLCGIGGSDYVEAERLAPGGDCESADLILADPSRVQAAWDAFKSMSPTIGSSAPILSQACMRPCAPDALPMIGYVPNVDGAIIASAHNCWGILWSPITGQIVSELILEGESSCCDIRNFTPSRFAKKATAGRGRQKVNQPIGEQW